MDEHMDIDKSSNSTPSTNDDAENEMEDQVEPLFSEIQASMMAEVENGDAGSRHLIDEHRHESLSKRHPWVVVGLVVVTFICIAVLGGGLFAGLTQTRKRGGHRNGGGIPNDNDTDVTDVTDVEITINLNSTGLQSRNAVGIIRNGMYESLDDQPLPVTLPLFSPEQLETYADCESLEKDLTNALNLIANQMIIAHGDDNNPPHAYYDNYGPPVPMEAGSNTKEESGASTSVDENSYGTNNQVKDVDEADIIKSNGVHVFAAYGSQLIVWDAITGEKLSVTNIHQSKSTNLRMIANTSGRLKVKSLLIYEDRLVAIVEEVPAGGILIQSVIQGPGKSKVLLYDISYIPSDETELPLLATKGLRGNYNDARLVGSTVHIISTASVDTFYHLTRYMQRGQKRYNSLNGTEYQNNAMRYSRSLLIPSYIERLMNETGFKNNTCTDILKLSMFQSTNEDMAVPTVGSIMDGFMEVMSFSIIGDHSNSTFETNSLASFVPSNAHSGATIVYSSSEYLVIGHRGYQFEPPPRNSWVPNTFVILLSLEDSGVEGVQIKGAAQIPGYAINQYALDIWDGHLRIASTIGAGWGCTFNESEETGNETRLCSWGIVSDSRNFLSILKVPVISQNSLAMERIGYLDNLGEFGETIEAVRFMAEKAWIVTFLKTDPLYSIDLSDHSSPVVRGELKVTGFSNYLHPFSDENFILGIGQDADKNGRATGLQISLFNVSELSITSLVHRYSFGEDNALRGTMSNSQAQYDPKAFRFLSESKKLIIPTFSRDESSNIFDGFTIFDISVTDGITVSFDVSHVDDEAETPNCGYWAHVSPRSLVHQGILTTIKGHKVLAHDLSTGKKEWKLSLDTGGKTACKLTDNFWIGN